MIRIKVEPNGPVPMRTAALSRVADAEINSN